MHCFDLQCFVVGQEDLSHPLQAIIKVTFSGGPQEFLEASRSGFFYWLPFFVDTLDKT